MREERRQIAKVVCNGCLSERYLHDLQEEIPGRQIYGKFNYTELVSDLGRDLSVGSDFERIITTPSHYAYVKLPKVATAHVLTVQYPSLPGIMSAADDDIEREVRWLTTKM